MYKRLPAEDKIKLIKRVKSGEKISVICKQVQISRTIFYKWLKEYKKAGCRAKIRALTKKYRQGKNHWKAYDPALVRKIINLSIKNPSYSSKTIGKKLGISSYGVWNTLKKRDLSTKEARERYILNNGKSLIKERDINEKITAIRRLENGEGCAAICRDFKVSRTIFYRWLRRYVQEGKTREALESLRPKGEKHWRYVPGAKDLVLEIVSENPKFTARQISQALFEKMGSKIIGSHGIYNILTRLNLNTYQRRLAFANSQVQVAEKEQRASDFSIPSFIKHLFVSWIAPPSGFRFSRFLKVFLPLTSLFSIFSLIFLIFIKTITQSGSIGSSIGLLFSFLSFFLGMFFFAYSFKYYLTIGIVLSFSRKDEEGKEDNRSFLSKLFGISIVREDKDTVKEKKEDKFSFFGKGKGLTQDLSNVVLKRKPFVSIHLATYNEKRVINRLLTAATEMDYDNYEIIVVDDSNDETRDILKQWENHPRVKIVYRENREGYKGGALKEALKITNPKAEFICIFDADFIPYPDTITQFLKYFQVSAGTLDFNNVASSKYYVSSRNNGESASSNIHNTSYKIHDTNRIAAIQGYQWHVLNKSENWITRGVRSEYSGSYVIERSGEEIYSGLKQISGSVYMIRKDVLQNIGWGTSITEDFQLTLKLYEQGYKVVYTPYIQAPAEAVSTIKRLIRQRMRWAEGHSHNVKSMFWRLLAGSWYSSSGYGNEARIDNRLRQTSPINETGIVTEKRETKTWKASPLTLSEKLEFLYLAPYYLQSFLFMLGTFSWFTAEVIFRVQLPFWTEVWGWSLVFTNLIALPLMNMVGLFLEEAEEKDYMGIFSFVVLSYIVAPFQGYAALKGFLAKEEGPWFRTPKTGRITDLFTRGHFYRKIFGWFGRPQGAAAKINASNQLSYLALSTANNVFNKFGIKPKRLRWMGKATVSILLLISLFISSISPYAPYIVKPKEANAQSTSSGSLVTPQGENSTSSASTTESALTLELSKTDFKAIEELEAYIGDSKKNDFKKIEVLNSNGNSIDIDANESLSNMLKIKQKNIFKPGKYKLKLTDSNDKTIEREFSWGVLGINLNKFAYELKEKIEDEAYIQMYAAKDDGQVNCNADLELEITSPLGVKTKPKIENLGKCSSQSSTDNPDYFSFYKFSEIGSYGIKLTDKTTNSTVTDSFNAHASLPFVIEREAPTRIRFSSIYETRIRITANQDIKGTAEEIIPKDFDTTYEPPSPEFKVKNNSDNTKKLQWSINWKSGETHELSYQYTAPNDYFSLYLFGPLTIKSSSVIEPTVTPTPTIEQSILPTSTPGLIYTVVPSLLPSRGASLSSDLNASSSSVLLATSSAKASDSAKLKDDKKTVSTSSGEAKGEETNTVQGLKLKTESYLDKIISTIKNLIKFLFYYNPLNYTLILLISENPLELFSVNLSFKAYAGEEVFKEERNWIMVTDSTNITPSITPVIPSIEATPTPTITTELTITPTPTANITPTSTPSMTPIPAPIDKDKKFELKKIAKESSNKSFKLEAQTKDFKPIDDPTFSIKFNDISSALSESNITIKNIDRKDALPLSHKVIKEADGSYTIQIKRPRSFTSGTYRISVSMGTDSIEQDFFWGVLAVNVNKTVYKPSDKAHIMYSLLTSNGSEICADGYLSAKIISPNGNIAYLSSEDGTLKITKGCGDHTINALPDYESFFNLAQPGWYEIFVYSKPWNEKDGEGHIVSDRFLVDPNVSFDVERFGPTRIDPFTNPYYPFSISIISKKDWSGEVIERLPKEFKVRNISDNGTLEENTEEKIVRWKLNLLKNEKKIISYEFGAPEISPEFYLLGTLQLNSNFETRFEEVRFWQLAADAETQKVCDWDGSSSDAWDTAANWGNGCNGTSDVPNNSSCNDSGGGTCFWVNINYTSGNPTLLGSTARTVSGLNIGTNTGAGALQIDQTTGTLTIANIGVQQTGFIKGAVQVGGIGGATTTGTLNLSPAGTATCLTTNESTAMSVTSAYGDVMSSNSNCTWDHNANQVITNEGTMSGTWSMNLAGGFTNTGTLNMTGGSFTVDTNSVTVSCDNATRSNNKFYNYTIGGAATTINNTFAGSCYFANTVTVTSSSGTNTLTTGTGTHELAGTGTPLVLNGETFTATANGTILYSGAGSTNITSTTYHHLDLKASSGTPTYTLGTATSQTITTNGNLTMGDATYNVSATAATYNPTIDVLGNLSVGASSSFTKGSGTLSFKATSGTQTWTDNNSTKSDMGTVSINPASGSTTVNLGSSVKATSVNVTASDTLGLGSSGYILEIAGSGQTTSRPFIVDGIFNRGTNSTVKFTGTSATDIENETYYNLTFAPSSGTPTYTLGIATSQTIIANGNLTMGDGTYNVSVDANTYDPTINVLGNLSIGASSSFTKGSGTLNFRAASGTQTWTDNNSTKSDMGAVTVSPTPGSTTVNLGSSVKATSVNIPVSQTLGLGSSGYTFEITGSGQTTSRPFIVGGTLTEGTNSTVKFTGTSATDIEDETYYNLTLGPAATVTYRLGHASSQTITVSGALVIGDDTNAVTVEATTYDPNISVAGNVTVYTNATFTNSDYSVGTLNIDGNLTIDTTGTFTAPAGGLNDSFTLGGSFTNNGTFNDNNGRLVLDTTTTATLSYSADTTFHDLHSTTGGKTIKFDSSESTIIESGAGFVMQGASCDSMITLSPETASNDWPITVTGAAYVTVSFATISYSTATGSPSATNSVNGGNNSGWSISDGCGAGIDEITAWSFQRKTFYDGTNDVYWRFSYDGSTNIHIEYSTDPYTVHNQASDWHDDTSTPNLAYGTNDFSVWDDDTNVYLAYASSNDIRVRKGTLGTTSITWDTTTSGVCTSGVCVALDGTGATSTYKYAYVTKDSSNLVWVVARWTDGTNYYMKAVRSSSADNLTAWDSVSNISSTSNTNANVYGIISSLGSQDMYASFIRGTAIEGCKWDNAQGGGARWEDLLDAACPGSVDSIATGKSGLSSNFSMSSDTSNNLHLAYIDSGDDVQYIRYTTSWGSAATIDNAGTSTYTAVSVNTTNNDVYVLYIRSSTVYYNKYNGSTWGGATDSNWTEGTSPKYLTANYGDPGRIYAMWTSGSGPYSINWDYIIIPERLAYLLVLGIFIPELIRRRRRKRIKAVLRIGANRERMVANERINEDRKWLDG